MTKTADATLTRKEIQEIFRRNKGSVQRVADILDISHVSVSQWLRRRMNSAKIETACRDFAVQLLEKEPPHVR